MYIVECNLLLLLCEFVSGHFYFALCESSEENYLEARYAGPQWAPSGPGPWCWSTHSTPLIRPCLCERIHTSETSVNAYTPGTRLHCNISIYLCCSADARLVYTRSHQLAWCTRIYTGVNARLIMYFVCGLFIILYILLVR